MTATTADREREAIAAHVARLVEQAPPLSADARRALQRLLVRPSPAPCR
jgi:hypothetical protein